jgi:hypothetical protein
MSLDGLSSPSRSTAEIEECVFDVQYSIRNIDPLVIINWRKAPCLRGSFSLLFSFIFLIVYIPGSLITIQSLL